MSKVSDIKKISFLFLVIFLFQGCRDQVYTSAEKPERVRNVKIVKIKKTENKIQLKFPSVIKPEKEVKLSFRVGGPIILLSLETGQKVKKGELIASIDPRDFISKKNQINAELESIKAELKEARIKYLRFKSLVKKNAAPQSEFDKADAGYQILSARLKAREKEFQASVNALNDTMLTAPFSGYINNIFIENHEIIPPGKPIASIINISNLEIEALIPEKLIPEVKNFSDFKFYPTCMGEKFYRASLKQKGEKSRIIDSLYPLTLSMEDNENKIKPGMTGILSFLVDNKNIHDIFEVPINSLLSIQHGSTIVWKLEKDRVNQRPVEIIKLVDKKHARIKSEKLKVGDSIVLTGSGFLKENQKVEKINSK